MKYGTALLFHRLEKLQERFGVSLPASNHGQIVDSAETRVSPFYEGLLRITAQAHIVHNDDTSVKVLSIAVPQKRDDFEISKPE